MELPCRTVVWRGVVLWSCGMVLWSCGVVYSCGALVGEVRWCVDVELRCCVVVVVIIGVSRWCGGVVWECGDAVFWASTLRS